MCEAFFKQRSELFLFFITEEGKKRLSVRILSGTVMQIVAATTQRAKHAPLDRTILFARLAMHVKRPPFSRFTMFVEPVLPAFLTGFSVKISQSSFTAQPLYGTMATAAGTVALIVSFTHKNPSFHRLFFTAS